MPRPKKKIKKTAASAAKQQAASPVPVQPAEGFGGGFETEAQKGPFGNSAIESYSIKGDWEAYELPDHLHHDREPPVMLLTCTRPSAGIKRDVQGVFKSYSDGRYPFLNRLSSVEPRKLLSLLNSYTRTHPDSRVTSVLTSNTFIEYLAFQRAGQVLNCHSEPHQDSVIPQTVHVDTQTE
eukprot:TRINITY_DN34497_c0_g1_i1.p1 TRINITY_DN34497_c0_g1~~TRINITY_DN34497_c0_g1_i1.p1  ORF type:complete len:192 (+),score=23.29 TRINITY_DN34497_c0_g1_i1:38-577(+)